MSKVKTLKTILLQTGIASGILLFMPAVIYVLTHSFHQAADALLSVIPAMFICFLIFMINYWCLIPLFYYRRKRALYTLFNLIIYALIIIWSLLLWLENVGNPFENIFIFVSTQFITLLLFMGSGALAIALRNSLKTKMLKEQISEEKRRHTEAELIWLKNQINPHFLFNTLNNISALVALDSDRAQDCIGRLSCLLRYAMYESSKQYVPLGSEVEFMKDYISLMSLRCTERTSIDAHFEVKNPSARIAPLLLVSIIENAFKHGVSAKSGSEIFIRLIENDGLLLFECSNTNHAKGSNDKSGSGIGLNNMRRRLELLYGDKYEWEQHDDGTKFKIIIEIRL